MVRLEGREGKKEGQSNMEFQFQYGTIRRSDWQKCHRHGSYFNSSMVRLEVITKVEYALNDRFQFQYGTIRSISVTSYNAKDQYFNSSMVRLEGRQFYLLFMYNVFQFQYGTIRRHSRIAPLLEYSYISIPVWYD